MSRPVIYALVDPRDPKQVRYVGHTSNLQQRLEYHISIKTTGAKKDWIEALKRDGIFPEIKILYETGKGMELQDERRFIKMHSGSMLLNVIWNRQWQKPRPWVYTTKSKLMDFKEVQAEVKLSASTIRTLRKLGRFPEPITIGLRKIAWHRDDIEAWKESGSK